MWFGKGDAWDGPSIWLIASVQLKKGKKLKKIIYRKVG